MKDEKLSHETEQMISIVREISERFDKAARSAPRLSATGTTDVLVSPCRECLGQGCDQCDGRGTLSHRFAKEIVALARALEYQPALQIAQVLSGLAIGMSLHKQ